MIRRLYQDVSLDILNGAGPRFTFTVFVGNHLREVSRKFVQIVAPQPADFHGLRFALLHVEFRPYWEALRLLRQPFQPQPLGRKNMRHELQRPCRCTRVLAYYRKRFTIRPFIVSKLTPEIVTQVHTNLASVRRRSEEHTSELQSLTNLVCRLL